MSKYEKPVVVLNEELAEGVYAASGDVDSDCWTVSAYIHQRPQTGRGDYRIQVNAQHSNPNMHRSKAVITIVFNMPVIVTGNDSIMTTTGSGSTTIRMEFDIGTSNPNENKGFGDLIVTADPGLEIVSTGIHCTGI